MYQTRITAGGDRIDYFGEVATHTATGGYHYLGSKDGTLVNGPILVLAKKMEKCYGICSRS
jgi:hypothetical protein